jgi:hypothetical protein
MTKEEKRTVLDRLYDLWIKHPTMRLTQLMGNCYHVPSGIDSYFEEDFDFVRTLEEFYSDM